MKSSHLIAIALGFVTIGLSLPASADQVATSTTVQSAIVSGRNNSVNQSSNTVIIDSGHDGKSANDATVARSRQVAEVDGDDNRVNQTSNTYIENRREQRHRWQY